MTLFDDAPITVPLSFVTTHACNSSSSEEEKMISSEEPPLLYLRMPLENTRKNIELSGLQVPASGLGIENFGLEDKRDETRLRDAAAGSNKCSVVATASVVIVGGGFGGGIEIQMEARQVRDKLEAGNSTRHITCFAGPRHRQKPHRASLSHIGFSITFLLRYLHPSVMAALAA